MSDTIEGAPPEPPPEPPAPHRMVNGRVVPLTAEEIAAREAEEAAYVRPVARWDVPKLLVIDRLRASGHLRAIFIALKRDAALADLTDAQLERRERWDAMTSLASDDAQVIAFLTAIGADPAAILARP